MDWPTVSIMDIGKLRIKYQLGTSQHSQPKYRLFLPIMYHDVKVIDLLIHRFTKK